MESRPRGNQHARMTESAKSASGIALPSNREFPCGHNLGKKRSDTESSDRLSPLGIKELSTNYALVIPADIGNENGCGSVGGEVQTWPESWQPRTRIDPAPRCLVFDSRFTSYAHPARLGLDGILLVIVLRRAKRLVTKALALPPLRSIHDPTAFGTQCRHVQPEQQHGS